VLSASLSVSASVSVSEEGDKFVLSDDGFPHLATPEFCILSSVFFFDGPCPLAEKGELPHGAPTQ
jgi:hypothetical protein